MVDGDEFGLQKALRAFLSGVGEDVNRAPLAKTPARVQSFLSGQLSGYRQDPVAVLGATQYPAVHPDMVIVCDIELLSLCEHHLAPFFGVCHVGYIPGAHVVGLSKLPDMVDVLARRLQMQERLTREVAATLVSALQPKGVGVVIEATHLCMRMHGATQHRGATVTSTMIGSFERAEVRTEFFECLRARREVSR